MTTNEAAERLLFVLDDCSPAGLCEPKLAADAREALAAAKAEGAREAALVEQGPDGTWGLSEKGARVLNAALHAVSDVPSDFAAALVHELAREEAGR